MKDYVFSMNRIFPVSIKKSKRKYRNVQYVLIHTFANNLKPLYCIYFIFIWSIKVYIYYDIVYY